MLPPIMSILLSVPLGSESSAVATKTSTSDLRRKASDLLGTLMKTYGPDYETLIPRKSGTTRWKERPLIPQVGHYFGPSRCYSNSTESTSIPGIFQIHHAYRHPGHASTRLFARKVPRRSPWFSRDKQPGVLA